MKVTNLKQIVPTFNIRLMLILSIFIIFFTMSKNYELVSIFFIFTFIILILFFVSVFMIYGIRKSESVEIFLLFSILLVSFLATIYGFMSFEYLKKYIMFSSTLIFFFICKKIEISKKIVDIIFRINIIIAITYLYFGYWVKIEYTHIGLTLNFANPNIAGMWLFHTILFLLMGVFFYKNTTIKLVNILIACMLIYLLVLTRARSVLISFVFFVALGLYIWKKRNIRLNKYMLILIILFPLFFTGIYFYMLDNSSLTLFDYFVSEGKSLYSRKAVWLQAFSYIKSYPLLGAYNLIPYQLHNTHIDIIASYGSIVFVLTMIYISRIVVDINKYCSSKFQTLAIIAFLSIIILGTFEGALFTGGTGLYILSSSFLILARYKDYE